MRMPFKILNLAIFVAIAMYAAFASAQYPGFGDPGASSVSSGVGAGIVPSNDKVDGGSIPIGATAQVVVLFRNDGAQPVETGTIRLYPSSTVTAQVSLNQCKGSPLPSGAECAIALSVKGLQAGPWRLEMLMSHSGRSRLVTSTISGTVETTEGTGAKQTSDIEMLPAELDFGSLQSAQTLVEPIILRNITSNPIDLKDIYVEGGDLAGYKLKTDCKKLEAGQACIATIAWSPKLKGRSSGVLVVKHTGPAGLSSVPLKGEYAPDSVSSATVFPEAVPGKGLLVASTEEVDFGNDIETASTITVSLVNSGDAPLEIQGIMASGSDNGIGFKEDGCKRGLKLQPVQACALTVTWSPTRVGDLLDDIQVLHTGARGVLILPIRGAATSTVSQDQKAIVLSQDVLQNIPPVSQAALDAGVPETQDRAARENAQRLRQPANIQVNASGALDGYKITSFAPTRAIINGPGGSRLVFNDEETLLGGVPWLVAIQKNGIEFMHKGQRVLLLFDRSLSSINRVSASASSNSTSNNNAGTETTDNTGGI